MNGGARDPGSMAGWRADAYSPGRRTALLMCGTGAHGAYHAGVLRAVQEAGVKIDLVAGQGIGAAAAALAAIDGAACLWEPGGLWRSPSARTFYTWKPLLRALGWIAVLLVAVLLVPLVVLVAGSVAYALGFLLTLVGLQAGTDLVDACSRWLQRAFSQDVLPLVVPRLAMAIVTVLVVAAAAGVLVARWRAPARRRSAGGWWWELAGAPLDAKGARSRFCNAVWTLIRGAAIGVSPPPGLVGRRYAEVLASGVGQPGFRDLLVVCTDLDARRDVVVALLSEPYRQEFLAPRSGRDRRAEVLDLAGADREYGLDVIAAAMTPPVACDPALVAFSADGFWRGEIHRLCDRPGAIHRVLEELSAAGVTQVILVSAVAASAGPHRLHRLRLDPRERLGDYLAAAESAALRDGLEKARAEFDGVYVVSPAHNAVGPFDLGGVYDEASDRQQALDELIERGYEDAYRQFIDPVVGEVGDGAVQEGV